MKKYINNVVRGAKNLIGFMISLLFFIFFVGLMILDKYFLAILCLVCCFLNLILAMLHNYGKSLNDWRE